MTVSIIGTGNLAWHLARVFEKNNIEISEIYGRELSKAILLTDDLYQSTPTDQLDFSESKAEIFIICVSDDAIEQICARIVLPENSILVHTSGAKNIDILDRTLKIYHNLEVKTGVFYPVMTFKKGKSVDFSKIPVCIESKDENTRQTLIKLAKVISDEVYILNSEERLALHVAAVFANNFTNHLLALSKAILDAEELDFEILKPIISETFKKALSSRHPAEVQTGPAKRNDLQTLKAHLDYISDDEDLVRVYKTLSESIEDWHQD